MSNIPLHICNSIAHISWPSTNMTNQHQLYLLTYQHFNKGLQISIVNQFTEVVNDRQGRKKPNKSNSSSTNYSYSQNINDHIIIWLPYCYYRYIDVVNLVGSADTNQLTFHWSFLVRIDGAGICLTWLELSKTDHFPWHYAGHISCRLYRVYLCLFIALCVFKSSISHT